MCEGKKLEVTGDEFKGDAFLHLHFHYMSSSKVTTKTKYIASKCGFRVKR